MFKMQGQSRLSFPNIHSIVGDVYHFNENGAQKDKNGWEAGMCLSLIKDGTKSCEEKEWLKVWSKFLSASLNDEKWSKERFGFSCDDL